MANNKLFVSNLDFELSAEQIREIFAELGTVMNLTLVRDRESGKSRGYAFIEMGSPEEAGKAIEALNGKQYNGRGISVAEDRGKKSSEPAAGQPRGEDDGGRRTGFQPLQPMQRVVFFKKKRRNDVFENNPLLKIDSKDVKTLSRFMSERGRILPRRLTGLSAFNQRRVSKAIKRAQNLGILPYTAV